MTGYLSMKRSFCCGVRELHGISFVNKAEMPQVVRFVYDQIWNTYSRQFRAAYIVFTAAGAQPGYGTWLRDYITTHGLGKVTKIGPQVNPNTKRKVWVYVWAVDSEVLKQWAGATRVVPGEESV